MRELIGWLIGVALVFGVAAYDAATQRCSVVRDMSFSGRPALYNVCRGGLTGTYGKTTFVRWIGE